jgi:hypothetical protein
MEYAKKQWKILRMKIYESKLTSTHAAQGLKHKLRKLSLKHFTRSPVNISHSICGKQSLPQ